MIATCRKCTYQGELDESLQKISDAVVQIRGVCTSCQSWVMWVPYKESTLVKSLLMLEASK